MGKAKRAHLCRLSAKRDGGHVATATLPTLRQPATVKINRAGFTEIEMMDTEDMFRKWFKQAKEERLLP